MKLKFICGAAALMLLASCQGKKADNSYSVNVVLPQEFNNSMVYLVDLDLGDPIDSVAVIDGVAIFTGNVEKPALVRLTSKGERLGTFVLEPGTITVENRVATGTALNELSNTIDTRMEYFDSIYNNTPDSLARAAIEKDYDSFIDSVTQANLDNPIGYYYFMQKAYSMDIDEFQQALAEHPSLGEYKRVQSLLKTIEAKAATSPGKKYADFEVVTSAGDTVRLSDYVGKGKPVLVDFWASWCGPCIRETKVIKEILKQYGPQGLEVLGVAVWDDPNNTHDAVEKHQLPWPQIDNAQNIPTDLYGIPAIPCIILIDGDGTILSRGKQGEDLKADVSAYFNGTLTSATLAAQQAVEGVAQD